MKIKQGIIIGLSCMMALMNTHLEAFAQDDEKNEVLHLTFENSDASDVSGAGNHGTIHGQPEFVDGPNGKAIHITNTTGATSNPAETYIDFGTASDLQFGAEDFTISYMYQAKTGKEAGGALISNKNYDSGGNTGFAFGIFSAQTGVNFKTDGGSRCDLRPFATQLDEEWHHVVAVFDRDGKLSGYLDGVKVAKEVDISGYTGQSIDAFNFVIGADGKFANSTVDASIDEVRVFRSALSEAQAIQLKEEAMPSPEVDEILHLTFDDETATDQSDAGNNGTIAGDIAFVDGIHGKAAHIVNENGNKSEPVSQYINLGKEESIHIGTDDFTVAFWYRGFKGTENGGAILADKNYNSGVNSGFAIGSFTNEVRANFANGSARKDIKTTPIDGGAWHHSAITFDRDGMMTTYTDGVLDKTADISAFASVDIGATDIVIGADTNKQNGLLDSVIDEVHIYRSVKDGAFIQSLYQEYQPNPVDPNPSDTLEEVLYVNFDGNTQDQSGKGNHGTVTGGPAYTSGVLDQALHIVNDNGSTSNTAKQYVDFGKASDLQFGVDDFSMSYWYKSDNGVSAGGALISNKNFNSGGNVGFNIGNFDNGFRFNFTPAQSTRFDAYDIAPIDGNWHHVSINVDRDGSIVTYLDGVKRKETVISASKGSIDAGNFVIGADGYFKNGLNDAFIDELHVYRGLQEESDILTNYRKEHLQLAYVDANTFYEKEHTNTLYDQTKMNALFTAITNAKNAIDQQNFTQADALIQALQ